MKIRLTQLVIALSLAAAPALAAAESFASSASFSTTLRMDYYRYATDLLAEAWHRPAYRVDFRMEYNLFGKVYLQAGLLLQGGMKAQDPVLSTVETLKTASDLHVMGRYFFSRQMSAFLQLDNCWRTSTRFTTTIRHVVYQALGGVSWSF